MRHMISSVFWRKSEERFSGLIAGSVNGLPMCMVNSGRRSCRQACRVFSVPVRPMGTMGTEASLARKATPVLPRASEPVLLRVPSGAIAKMPQ